MRLRTIGLISTLALGLLAGPLPAQAQEETEIPRVGYLAGRSRREDAGIKALRRGLRELGYVRGQNIVIMTRSAREKGEAELVRLKVDVIVTTGNPRAIRAAQRATRTIPIVMGGIGVDPVKAGYVMSLARPGGNVTGISNLDWILNGKRLEILKEAFPRISRVAILWPPSHRDQHMKEVETAGQALGIQIQSVVVRRSNGIESALSAISRERPDGLIVPISSPNVRHRARIAEFTAKRRLPTIYGRSQFVKAGGLMSYGADRQHLFRRVATFVDKILKGAKPADLPVEQPIKFELIINLKAAKQIGFTIPPEVLAQADKVIK